MQDTLNIDILNANCGLGFTPGAMPVSESGSKTNHRPPLAARTLGVIASPVCRGGTLSPQGKTTTVGGDFSLGESLTFPDMSMAQPAWGDGVTLVGQSHRPSPKPPWAASTEADCGSQVKQGLSVMRTSRGQATVHDSSCRGVIGPRLQSNRYPSMSQGGDAESSVDDLGLSWGDILSRAAALL